MASNCRCVKPRVGDSGGTAGAGRAGRGSGSGRYRAGNWHYRVPALHINGGGLPSRQDAEQDCLAAIAFALEGNPADYDPSAEALTLDVTVAPAA
jgi:hypothetical protein